MIRFRQRFDEVGRVHRAPGAPPALPEQGFPAAAGGFATVTRPDDPVLHICALAYMSDLTLLGSAQVSLDVRASCGWHRWTMRWFSRPFPRRQLVAVRPVVAVRPACLIVR